MAEKDSFGALDWLRLVAAVVWLGIFVIWPQSTFAVTLLIIGGAFIAFNAMVFWLTVVRRGKASSIAPIVGGVIAAAGIVILPVSESWKWFWVPLVIDWGGLPHFLTVWYVAREKR
jgi:hypothetical protein